jgi:hypothetical protein
MDAAGLSVIAVLCAVIVLLGAACVVSLWRVSRLADKCINHALAESYAQRDVMRMKHDAEHQELLLREARRKDRKEVRMPDHVDGSEPDIQVATGRFDGA